MSREKKKLPYEDEFVKWLEEERQVKPITIESYLSSLGVMSQNLPIPLHKITSETLRDYIDVRLVSDGVAIPSILLNIGAVSMPALCYLSAWKSVMRHLFFIPALSVTVAIVFFIIRISGL